MDEWARVIGIAMLIAVILSHGSMVAAQEAHAPIYVREAPDNESDPVLFEKGRVRIYYIEPTERRSVRSIGSMDNGRSWGDDRLEFALPGQAYHAIQVVRDDRGDMHAVTIIRAEGPRGRQWNLWYNRSTGEQNWGEPRKIYEGYIGALRSFQQLPGGRLILPVHVFTHYDPRPSELSDSGIDFGQGDCIVFFSDDRGNTWNRSSSRLSVPMDARRSVSRYGACEPIITRMRDGRLWMLMRNKNGQLWESFSSDDGITWTQALPTVLTSSDSPAATTRLADGRLVLFLNACQRWDNLRAYASGGREVLHAAISHDDGRTWRGFREVLREPTSGHNAGDRGTAYPAAVTLDDGNVLLVTGQGFAKSIIIVDPNWLDATTTEDDFSDGLGQWSFYGAAGADLVSHPDSPGRQILAIRRTNPRAQACGVWNFPSTRRGELTMRVRLDESFGGGMIALTDHFNVAADKKAHEHGVGFMTIAPSGEIQRNVALTPGKWHELRLTWEVDRRVVVIEIDGKPRGHFMLDRDTPLGINYLRVMATGDPGTGGLMLESVRFNAIHE